MPAFAEVAGKIVRTGKKAPRTDLRTLRLTPYLAGKLPPLPHSLTRSSAVQNWGEMGNDSYGDCTCASAGHAIQLASAVSSGTVAAPTDSQILDAYWATGNPPDPGADDTGRVELDILNYWRSTGIGGHRAQAFVALDLRSFHGQVRRAIDMFGFAYIGLALPKTAQPQTVWDVAFAAGSDSDAGSWGGHAVVLVDYDRVSATCVTWGRLVKMTWRFFKRYCDEAYAVLLPEWLNTQGVSVEGLDLAALEADLAVL